MKDEDDMIREPNHEKANKVFIRKERKHIVSMGNWDQGSLLRDV